MVRTPSKDKSGLRKGTWTLEEDMKLIAYVTRYGCWNWSLLPKFAGLARCGKSCRLRWLNYLRPDLKRGNFTQEEEDTIIRLHTKLGNRWSVIASNLPGRTDNEIKNHWHTALKKRFQEQKVVTKKEAKLSKLKDYNEPKPQVELIQNKGILPAISRNSVSSSTPSSSNHNFSVLMEDDEFAFLDADRTEQTEIGAENNDSAFFDSHIETMIENFWSEPYKVDMSHIPNEYSSMVNDDDLWSRSNLYDEEHIRLF